jgi:hypothetical protein
VRVWGWIGATVVGGRVGVGVGVDVPGTAFPDGWVGAVVSGGVVAGVAEPSFSVEAGWEDAPPGSARAAYTENAPTSPTAVTAVQRVTRETRLSPVSRRRRPASRGGGLGAATPASSRAVLLELPEST